MNFKPTEYKRVVTRYYNANPEEYVEWLRGQCKVRQLNEEEWKRFKAAKSKSQSLKTSKNA